MSKIVAFCKLVLKPKTLTFLVVAGFAAQLFAGDKGTVKSNDMKQTVRFEHLALKVKDVRAMVKWYEKNLDFKVMSQSGPPSYNTMLADSGENFMFELSEDTNNPVFDFTKYDWNTIHIAFFCNDIPAMKEKLLADGATVADDIKTNDAGDQFLVMRDPWGMPIQFAHRVHKMIDHKGIFFEHLAMNQKDSREKAKWFVDNVGLEVVREGKAPDYGMFVSDPGKNMMFELYQKKDYEVIDFSKISYGSFHIASVVDDVEAMKANLLKHGATVADDIHTSSSGDVVLTMRDPWGMPIQYIKRAKLILK